MHVHYWRTRTCKKAVCRARGGERENEGHVLKDTTSRGPRPRLAVSHGACAALSSAHAGGPGPETRSGPASRRPAPAATGFPRPAGAGAARGSWREPPAAGAAYPLAHVFDSPLPPPAHSFLPGPAVTTMLFIVINIPFRALSSLFPLGTQLLTTFTCMYIRARIPVCTCTYTCVCVYYWRTWSSNKYVPHMLMLNFPDTVTVTSPYLRP